MIKFIKLIAFTLFFYLQLIGLSFAINYYKYPLKNFDSNVCKKIFDDLNIPHPYYDSEDPIVVRVDFYIDKIFKVEAQKGTFEAQVNLWLTWNEPRLKKILDKYNLYTDSKKKPYYLCSFDPSNSFSNFKLFDPSIDFFNRIDKPEVENHMADWVDIFSDGTIDQRLKDTATFHSTKFDFRKFPFDEQQLYVELWSEYPSMFVELEPNEPYMTAYAQSGIYDPVDNLKMTIDGWNIKSITYETYSYLDNDGLPYTGFLFYINIKRLTSYYVFKIILPIIFLLVISWSVFWVRGSQLEAKVNVTIVCLLSLIAYNFIIDEDLPKLSYLTFLDSFILMSYFYTGIATVLCVYSFTRKLKSRKNLSNVDLLAQKWGPISYFSLLFIMLVYFYNLDGTLSLLAAIIS